MSWCQALEQLPREWSQSRGCRSSRSIGTAGWGSWGVRAGKELDSIPWISFHSGHSVRCSPVSCCFRVLQVVAEGKPLEISAECPLEVTLVALATSQLCHLRHFGGGKVEPVPPIPPRQHPGCPEGSFPPGRELWVVFLNLFLLFSTQMRLPSPAKSGDFWGAERKQDFG